MRFTTSSLLIILVAVTCWPTVILSWSLGTSKQTSRLEFFKQTVALAAGSSAILAAAPSRASASSKDGSSTLLSNSEQSIKLTNLSNDEIKKIVLGDLNDRHFLVTGGITRSVYDESATFTDEIDTYGMDQWIQGTQKLFVGEGSTLNLVGDVEASPSAVEFRFEEDLMFRIPFRPVVHLTGKVVLTRSPETGLITSYREFWDQDVLTVLKSARV